MKTFENMGVIPMSDSECLTTDGGYTWWELEMYATSAWSDAKVAFKQGLESGYNAFHLQ